MVASRWGVAVASKGVVVMGGSSATVGIIVVVERTMPIVGAVDRRASRAMAHTTRGVTMVANVSAAMVEVATVPAV